MPRISDSLTLASGLVLPNRLAKTAMTEGLAEKGRPGLEIETVYRRWAASSVGLLITGNVMIDRHHLERPGNVVIDRLPDADMRARLKRWAEAAKSSGGKVIMQLSHAGRQTPVRVNKHPKAPSTVRVNLPGRQFGDPVALSEDEIHAIIDRFGVAAAAAREGGFDGVQVHAAHGYLISEFLSPKTNCRNDRWGGSLENRARLLLDVVRAVRTATGQDFTLAVKLNSADFQKGGFAFEDSLTVAGWLKEAGVDLLEISGGSYEQPRMMAIEGVEKPLEPKAATTRLREAYFLDFAKQMIKAPVPPLMVTGGFRSADAMDEALQSGIDLIGLGRPLCTHPDAVLALLRGVVRTLPRTEDALRLGPGLFGPNSPVIALKALNGFATLAWYYQQIRRMGRGETPDLKLGVLRAFLSEQRDDARKRREEQAS